MFRIYGLPGLFFARADAGGEEESEHEKGRTRWPTG